MAGVVRPVAWVAILVATVALLAAASFAGGGAETDAERIQRLQASFACPECQGESVAESQAAVAATIRQFIANEVGGGATDTEIRNDLLDAWGTEVLLTPPAEGVATLLWVLPVMIVVGGAVAVAAVANRGRGIDAAATDADRELVRQARADPDPGS
ncbi:MAG: cytochrome c-type biogenesis protein CcmH [Actinomycetota bacterium]